MERGFGLSTYAYQWILVKEKLNMQRHQPWDECIYGC